MATREFSKESVKEFILLNGGRVTNHELVTHFKSHLNDPQQKALNRQKFKEYVNSLATIKVDEKGEKVLVLRKEYYPRDCSLPTSLSASDLQNSSGRAQSEPPQDLDTVDGAFIMSRGKSEGNLDNAASMTSLSSDSRGVSLDLSTSSISSTNSQQSAEESMNASVVSVKDRAIHLNKIHSESELQRPPHPARKKDFRLNKEGDVDDDSHSSGLGYVTLGMEEKEWLVVSASADYHPINSMLNKNPALVKVKNFINGYTALHWASKHGKPEVVKLIAGNLGANVNQRTHGGYTSLHIAAMQGNEDLIELLVQVYKADPNIRDYSGKKAKQYLRSNASTKAQLYTFDPLSVEGEMDWALACDQEMLLSRRLGANIGKSVDDSFMRTSSFRNSNRAHAISSLIQASPSVMRQSMFQTECGSSENATDERIGDRPTSAQPFTEKDIDLMPPPTAPMRKSKRGGQSSSKEHLDVM